jgi:hypothetical protein
MLGTVQSKKFCLSVCCQKNIRNRIYEITILPSALCGHETRSLILREEHKERASENRRIFGSKMEKVTSGRRKLHKEGLRDLNSSLL